MGHFIKYRISHKRSCSSYSKTMYLLLNTCLNLFRADEEPVDQKKYLEDRCKPKCAKPLFEYQVNTLNLHPNLSDFYRESILRLTFMCAFAGMCSEG